MAETYRNLDKSAREGMKTSSDKTAAVSEVWVKIRSDSEKLNFLWSIYSDGEFSVIASGETLEAMAEAVTKDNIHYGGVRAEVKGKVQFFHAFYVGSGVSIIKVGKAQLLKSAVFGAMEGASGEIVIEKGSDVTADSIAESIASAVRCSVEDISI